MKQITLLVDDKMGLLADISFILGKSKINIESISVGLVGGKAVINLAVQEDKRAVELLEANGYKCLESDMLVVKMSNKPGELANLSKLLAENEIKIENISSLGVGGGFSLYGMKVDKMAKAEKLLAPYLALED